MPVCSSAPHPQWTECTCPASSQQSSCPCRVCGTEDSLPPASVFCIIIGELSGCSFPISSLIATYFLLRF